MSSIRKYIPENSDNFLETCKWAREKSRDTGEYWTVERLGNTDTFYISAKYNRSNK